MRVLVVRDLPNGSIEQLEHQQRGTRLGEGLEESGTLAPAAIRRTLDAVRDFVAVAQAQEALLATIATSALRRADDARTFAVRMREITGVELDVLDGATEARASFRGATYGDACDGSRIAVVDVGGGSTEVAAGRGESLERSRSIEIGSVRVTERFPALAGGNAGREARAAAATARGWIADMVAPFVEMRPVHEVRCVAGTSVTIAAIALRAQVDAVRGARLPKSALDATIDGLLDMTLDERRGVAGMLPQRADILCGGAIVLSETLRALDAGYGIVETNDLLLGYLLLQQEATARDERGP